MSITAPAATFSERVVTRLTTLGRSTDQGRRSFLQRATLVATALTVNPFDFILKPVTAYASVCGDANECSDGWSAFCCTINDGKNTCPPGSYAAGWWKVDDSAFCRGSARYYIDCNRHPTTGTCRCTCASGNCDRRRVCCNNFRYGQCNQHIKGTTPVVCRIVTCMPPWEWDPSCTRTSLSSPSTRTHSASCLPGEWPSHIQIKYQDMGLRGSVLGDPLRSEQSLSGGGRYRHYENGFIYWRSDLGAREVHGVIAKRYDAIARHTSALGYPTTDQRAVGDGRGTYNRFERGAIYHSRSTGAWEVTGGFDAKHRQHGGVRGTLGYPVGARSSVGDSRGTTVRFQHGVIYHTSSSGTAALWGDVLREYGELGGPTGHHQLGYPTSDTQTVTGGQYARFEGGQLHWRVHHGGHAVWGAVATHYERLNGAAGVLGPLVRGLRRTPLGEWAMFEGGGIYASDVTGVHEVRTEIHDKYLSLGGPRGLLAMPKGSDRGVGDARGRRCDFTGGSIWWALDIGAREVHGPILDRYLESGGATGRLGYPVTDVRRLSDGRQQSEFEGGVLTYDPASGEVTLSSR